MLGAAERMIQSTDDAVTEKTALWGKQHHLSELFGFESDLQGLDKTWTPWIDTISLLMFSAIYL